MRSLFSEIPVDAAFVSAPDDRVRGWRDRPCLHYNKVQRLRGPVLPGREPLGYINGDPVRVALALVAVLAVLPGVSAQDWVVAPAGGTADTLLTMSEVSDLLPWYVPSLALPAAEGEAGGRGAGPVVVAPPYDLYIEIEEDHVVAGKRFPLTIWLNNTGRTADLDSRLTYWLTDPNGTRWAENSEPLNVPSGMTPYRRTLYTPPNASIGEWNVTAVLTPPGWPPIQSSTQVFVEFPRGRAILTTTLFLVGGFVLGMLLMLLVVRHLGQRRPDAGPDIVGEPPRPST